MHEYRMTQAAGVPSWFLTLTCDPDHEQPDGKAMYRELQLWIKRLRERIAPDKFRYLAVAERGTKTQRWHGHAGVFGLELPDARPLRMLDKGCDVVTSRLIESSWARGHVEVAPFNDARAEYLSGYLVKGAKGEHREPCHWSQGLGDAWFHRYGRSDVLPGAAVVLPGGVKRAIPRRYKAILKKEAPELYEMLVEDLKAGFGESWEHRVPSRLEVMEEVAVAASREGRKDVL